MYRCLNYAQVIFLQIDSTNLKSSSSLNLLSCIFQCVVLWYCHQKMNRLMNLVRIYGKGHRVFSMVIVYIVFLFQQTSPETRSVFGEDHRAKNLF